MAISPVVTQSALSAQLTGQAIRTTPSKPEDAAQTLAERAIADGANLQPIDARSAILNAQKSEKNQSDTAKAEEPNSKQVESAVEKLNKFIKTSSSDVQFSVDEESGIRVISVVDKETKEVIRQMPSKEVVEMAKALDKLQGLLIKQTA